MLPFSSILTLKFVVVKLNCEYEMNVRAPFQLNRDEGAIYRTNDRL